MNMKKIRTICMGVIVLICGWKQKSHAQVNEIAQLALNIEKLSQFRSILSDMKKGYKILNGGYNTIKNISEGNFNIHKEFLDGLMDVSPAVKNYRKVPQIIRYQLLLTNEYKSALNRFRQSDVFDLSELQYMERVYGNLLKHSLRSLDELLLIITSNKMRMSDDERLKAIDKIFDDMEEKLVFLRGFNNNTSVLELQRTKEKKSIESSRSRYGLDH
jgi:DNA repair ATPase RecN